MRILVTGATGQLGIDVCMELKRRQIEHRGISTKDVDITDAAAVSAFIKKYSPDAVIHCAAYTKVDSAEEESELCRAVNVDGTRNIAIVCREIGAKLLYISTEYVFSGEGNQFYKPDDPVTPKNVYGQSKLDGELAVKELLERFFIVRISWLFSANGNNFVKTMLGLAETKQEIDVVCDQIGSPTYTADLAPLLCDMVTSDKYGVYHASNEGVCSWAEFAEEIFRAAEKQVKVRHIPSSEYPVRAVRPLNSRMNKDKLGENGFYKLPAWQYALRRCIDTINNDGRIKKCDYSLFKSNRMKLVYKTALYIKNHGVKAACFKIYDYLRKERKEKRNADVPLTVTKVKSFAGLIKTLKRNKSVKIYLPEILKRYDKQNKKKILLVSHELSMTGAPIAICYFARVLKENGYSPVMLSPLDGRLAKAVVGEEIPLIILPNNLWKDFIPSFIELFSLIELNTTSTACMLDCIDGIEIPVFWWVHEAKVSYSCVDLSTLPLILTDKTSVYAGGGYAKRMLKDNRPEYDIKELLYYVPDYTKKSYEIYPLPQQADGKFIFCIIGTLVERKGQDICADAILQLPEAVRKQSYFVFVGEIMHSFLYQRIMELCELYPENILYIDQLDREDICALNKRMDCLICSSSDDPMPLVVTEALLWSKLVICSEYTGSAEFLLNEQSGLVYQNNDPKKLAEYITYVVQHSEEMDSMRKAARQTYEKHFSRQVFEKNVLSEVERLLNDVKRD